MGQVFLTHAFLGVDRMARISRARRVPLTSNKAQQPVAITRHDLSARERDAYVIVFG